MLVFGTYLWSLAQPVFCRGYYRLPSSNGHTMSTRALYFLREIGQTHKWSFRAGFFRGYVMFCFKKRHVKANRRKWISA